MGAKSRRKGAGYEWELAKRWRESGLYPDAHRGGGSQAQRFRPKGVPDVDGTPYFVEAKRRTKHRSPPEYMAQAVEASDERVPIVVARWDRQPADEAIVMMRLADFEALVRAQRDGWEAP
jgi:hypothetical protein